MEWTLNESGVLTIVGDGKLADCTRDCNPPYGMDEIKDRIREVHILEGVTEIGINAFRDCKNLERVVCPWSLEVVHAYAFRGCERLVSFETQLPLQYRYEEEINRDENIIFGRDAFRGTPWSETNWGEFYIQNGQLYFTCAVNKKELTIPKNVWKLRFYSLSDLNLDQLNLPDGIIEIEDLAFSGTTVRNSMELNVSKEALHTYSLADCSIPWEMNPLFESLLESWKKLPAEERARFPKASHLYNIRSVRHKECLPFRHIQFGRKQMQSGKSCVIDHSPIDVGDYVIRRIRQGDTILRILSEDNKIIKVYSYRGHKEEGEEIWNDPFKRRRVYWEIEGYRIQPILDESGYYIHGDAAEFYLDENILHSELALMDEKSCEEAIATGELECRDENSVRQDWFWIHTEDEVRGPIELELTSRYLRLQPGSYVQNAEEWEEENHERIIRSMMRDD